jgi:hypothetical protein
MFSDLCHIINFKVAIFLFIFGMLLFSDVFINNVLSKFQDATSGDAATTKGTVVQLSIFVLFYLVIDILGQSEVI